MSEPVPNPHQLCSDVDTDPVESAISWVLGYGPGSRGITIYNNIDIDLTLKSTLSCI